MPSFRLTPLAACLLLGPMALSPQGVAGRYAFSARSAEGNAFTGVIHLYPDGADHWAGRVITTIREPLTITRVVVQDTLVTVVADPVAFRWNWRRDSVDGMWRFGDQTGTIAGRNLGSEPGDALTPVPCRLSGVQAMARCGTLLVPERRDTSGGRRIPLAVVILPATEPGPHGALATFAGGPGQSAAAQAAGDARRFAAINRQRDLLLVDQRGTGGSHPLACEFTTIEERTAALFGGFLPAAVATRCRDALATQADLRFYTTWDAADDMEAVRRWLGYDALDLYGGSYGTRAALAFMAMHPGSVRTATLRAVLPLDASLIADNPRDAEASFELLSRTCASDAACAAAHPALRERLSSAMTRLRAQPGALRLRDPVSRDSVTIAVTPAIVAGALRRMLMDGDSWFQVPALVDRLAAGDLTPLTPGVEATLGAAGSIAWGMGVSVLCTEDLDIVRAADRRLAERSFLGAGGIDGMLAVCPAWPVRRLPAAPPLSAVKAPVLLLSGALDPTTPARWARAVAATLPSARLVVMPWISHGPFPPCAQELMAAFVDAGALVAVDDRCEHDPPPGFSSGGEAAALSVVTPRVRRTRGGGTCRMPPPPRGRHPERSPRSGRSRGTSCPRTEPVRGVPPLRDRFAVAPVGMTGRGGWLRPLGRYAPSG